MHSLTGGKFHILERNGNVSPNDGPKLALEDYDYAQK